MKRIIDGKTYNTQTATLVAKYEYENQQGIDVEAKVYVNNRGRVLYNARMGSGRWPLEAIYGGHFSW